jgi:hypothetical protein
MQLPNHDRAIISPEKLRDYLLSDHHPAGRFKATFFRRLGYTRENWGDLEAALRAQHLVSDAQESGTTVYGRKFVIVAPVEGPSGETAPLVSVWVIRRGEEVPRFVTAYPGRKA